MNKYTLGTIIGAAALGLAKSKKPFGNRNVFQNIGLPIWKQFEKANKGLSNGSLQGIEVAGDSFELTPLLQDNSIDSIITSPPYFQMRKYSESNQEIGQEMSRSEYIETLVNLFVDLMPKLKDDGVLVVNIDALSRFSAVKVMGTPYEFVCKMEASGWTLRYDMKWIKPSFGGWRSTFSPGKNFEHVFGFIKSSSVKEGIKHYNYNQMHEKGKNQHWKLFTSTIYENGLNHKSWSNDDSRRFLERFNKKEDKHLLSHLQSNAYMHGAPLNPRVAWILVQLFSKPGNVVLDPFSGSGTITKVSKLCGRKAIGFELEKVHSKLAVIGEAFTKNFDDIHKEYMRSGKDKAFGGKGVSQLTPIKPFTSWKDYDPNKTMWIDASYLNISGSRSRKSGMIVIHRNIDTTIDDTITNARIPIVWNNTHESIAELGFQDFERRLSQFCLEINQKIDDKKYEISDELSDNEYERYQLQVVPTYLNNFIEILDDRWEKPIEDIHQPIPNDVQAIFERENLSMKNLKLVMVKIRVQYTFKGPISNTSKPKDEESLTQVLEERISGIFERIGHPIGETVVLDIYYDDYFYTVDESGKEHPIHSNNHSNLRKR